MIKCQADNDSPEVTTTVTTIMDLAKELRNKDILTKLGAISALCLWKCGLSWVIEKIDWNLVTKMSVEVIFEVQYHVHDISILHEEIDS